MPKTAPKKVDDLSVKELKAELQEYGVDFVGAGCVEKNQLRDLLAKTRAERGWPPKAASGAAKDDDSDEAEAEEVPLKSSKGASSSTAGASASTSARATNRGGSGGGRVPASLRVAVLFDPDNDDIRDASQFIQPFFTNTRECSDSQNQQACPKVAWILPASLRDDFVRLKLPEQLANFEWFTAIFVAVDGTPTDFDANAISLKELKQPAVSPTTAPVNLFAHVALRWDATWIVVRAPGGVLPRGWMTSTHVALTGSAAAARVGGVVIVDVSWHRKNVVGAAAGVLVPDSLDPKSAWYYWLLQVYPNALVFKLDAPEDAAADVDKVMVACEEAQYASVRDAIKKK